MEPRPGRKALGRRFQVEPPDPGLDEKLEKARQKARRISRQDGVRASIAIIALFLVVLTVWLGYVATNGPHWGAAKDWLSAVLPAETGILGSALGFYFGANRNSKD